MKTTIEFHSMTDEKGNCSFTLYWTDKQGVQRGQCFRADPHNYGHKRPEEE